MNGDRPPGTAPTPRILVLCTANVCRSVFAAHLLRSLLPAGSVEVPSAGLGVSSLLPACSKVTARVLAGGHDDAHPSPATGQATGSVLPLDSSRPLEPGELPDAALVLTMTTHQRAAVVRLDPSVRRRTFTLLEAELLASGTTSTGKRTLSQWVRHLDDARSRTPLPPSSGHTSAVGGGHLDWARALPRLVGRGRRATDGNPGIGTGGARRGESSTLDIPDGHTSGVPATHASTLDVVERACLALSSALHGVLLPPPPRTTPGPGRDHGPGQIPSPRPAQEEP